MDSASAGGATRAFQLLRLAREIAAKVAAQSDPDACLRHLRAGLLRLGFRRAGIALVDPDNPSQVHGTWGTDWDGQEVDEHACTWPIRRLLSTGQLREGERIRLLRLAPPPSRSVPADYELTPIPGPPNSATVDLRADGVLLGLIAVDMLPSDDPIEDHHLVALELLADQVAVAVARSRLVSELWDVNARLLADIAARQRVERALLQSEERFRRLAENAHDVIYRFELVPTFQLSYVSPAVFRILGYTPGELYANPVLGQDLLHPEERQGSLAFLRDGGKTVTGAHVRFRHRDGQTIWMDVRQVPIFDPDGKLLAVEGIARDITASKLAEVERDRLIEAVARERATLAAIIAGMSDGLVMIDLERCVRYCNAPAGRLLGIDPADVVGARADRIVEAIQRRLPNPVQSRTLWDCLDGKALGPDECWRFDARLAGEEPIDLSCQLFRVAIDGTPHGTAILLRDVTALKKLALLQERERIAMDLHDGVMQTLYGVTLGLGAHLRSLGEESAATREAIHRAMSQINATLRDLRHYIYNLRPSEPGATNLVDGLAHLAHELRVNALIQPRLDLDPSLADLVAPDVVDNVLYVARDATTNVIRHAGASEVAIRLSRLGDRIVLTIADNGVGFDATTPPEVGRSGLRNMAKRAEAIGGCLQIASARGQGTVVRLEFPLVP